MKPVTAPSVTHLFSYSAILKPPEIIGPVPEGIRANFYVVEGVVDGPRLQGLLLPVGGDWLTIRSDGVVTLDVRITLQTTDGALVYMSYPGMGDLGEQGYDKFLRGDLPARLSLRTTPVFRTAAPQHQWLHRMFCVSTGEVDFASSEVRYDVFAIA